MKLEKIYQYIDEKQGKSYLMDRCLMWFLYRYKELKWSIEEYEKMPKFFEPNISGDTKRLAKEIRQTSIEFAFVRLLFELADEMKLIVLGRTSDGEKFKVKNTLGDLQLRLMFYEEVKKDEKRFSKLKMEHDIIRQLTAENRFLRKRIAELEWYRKF